MISKMLVENSNRRTFPVDRHAGVAIAGVAADGRAIVNRAMAEASQYKSFYGDPIPGHVLAERLGTYVHVFNLYWWAVVLHAEVILLARFSLGCQRRVQSACGAMPALHAGGYRLVEGGLSPPLCPKDSRQGDLAVLPAGMCARMACPPCWPRMTRRGRSCTWWSRQAPHM